LIPTSSSIQTLNEVLRNFYRVADYEENNQMTAEALAIVFSPNLMRAPRNDFVMILANMGYTHKLVKALITHVRSFHPTPTWYRLKLTVSTSFFFHLFAQFNVIFDEADPEAEMDQEEEDEFDLPIVEEDEDEDEGEAESISRPAATESED
jgi:hypothetical protein